MRLPIRHRLVACVLAVATSACAVSAAAPSTTGHGARLVDMQRFTSDTTGAAQTEESVATCGTDPRLVLGASDDGRGQDDPDRGIVSWALSVDGRALAKDGPLPAVHIGQRVVRTSADPVTAIGPGPSCPLYAAALAFTNEPTSPGFTSAIAGFYSPRTTLTGSCRNQACWPMATPVAVAPPGRFYDKDWMAVGNSGTAGTVAWFIWIDRPATDPTSGVAMISRCAADLTLCTPPQRLSDPGDDDPEFGDITIAPSGRVYFTWRTITGQADHTIMTVKLRTAEPGAITPGPTRIVAVDDHVMPLGGRLNGNDFLVADAYPKTDVATLPDGHDRIFATWDRCGARVRTVCEDSRIVLTWSDDHGVHWTTPDSVTPPTHGNRYFPTLSVDHTTDRLVIAYYSTELDPRFDTAQDVFADIWDIRQPHPVDRVRVTSVSNQPGVDPNLPHPFIGSYFQINAVNGIAHILFNANYVKQQLHGQGAPVPQQDTFLATIAY
ncbi:hypothetical protein BCF44_13718 [Kutzneria buriramensis]|uniref:BNR repeat protein n=2 Tax=Kutzneria buriramensis TaxID=1045776 RepID=A0A3E0G5I7_9PSEU|nr:hypothetical protein BCF44_13718 [Kutzneria buriramensis]